MLGRKARRIRELEDALQSCRDFKNSLVEKLATAERERDIARAQWESARKTLFQILDCVAAWRKADTRQ